MKSAKKSTWRRSHFYESRKHQSDSHCKSGWNDRPMTEAAVLTLGASLTRTSRAGCAVCGEFAIKVPCKYLDKVASQFPLNPDRVWFQFH